MQFMEKVIGLVVINLIWFIVLCIYGVVCSTMFPMLDSSVNTTIPDQYSTVHSIYSNVQTMGWIGLLIFGLGSIAYLLISSQQEEYEQYREYNPQENNRQ